MLESIYIKKNLFLFFINLDLKLADRSTKLIEGYLIWAKNCDFIVLIDILVYICIVIFFPYFVMKVVAFLIFFFNLK